MLPWEGKVPAARRDDRDPVPQTGSSPGQQIRRRIILEGRQAGIYPTFAAHTFSRQLRPRNNLTSKGTRGWGGGRGGVNEANLTVLIFVFKDKQVRSGRGGAYRPRSAHEIGRMGKTPIRAPNPRTESLARAIICTHRLPIHARQCYTAGPHYNLMLYDQVSQSRTETSVVPRG